MDVQKLTKGYSMEECLRNYFLDMGYYVVRGIKYSYKGSECTDIDLFLYHRPSILSRERINVDIKNKKSPQAMERIFVAKGIQTILGFDKCIVATKDIRSICKEFADAHDVILLGGILLAKIGLRHNQLRYSEEDFFKLINSDSLGNLSGNWKNEIERLKSSLLDELDFSGCIDTLESLKLFIEEGITNRKRQEAAIRCLYLLLSFFLIKLDFIMKDVAFLENDAKINKINNGLKFGNMGEDGVKNLLNMLPGIAPELQLNKVRTQLSESFNSIPVSIITEFYTRNDISKNIFKFAKELENFAYEISFTPPNKLSIELKSIISITLDYFKIERKKFFNSFL